MLTIYAEMAVLLLNIKLGGIVDRVADQGAPGITALLADHPAVGALGCGTKGQTLDALVCHPFPESHCGLQPT